MWWISVWGCILHFVYFFCTDVFALCDLLFVPQSVFMHLRDFTSYFIDALVNRFMICPPLSPVVLICMPRHLGEVIQSPITQCRSSGWYFRGHRSVMTEPENTSTSKLREKKKPQPCWWSHLLDSVASAFKHRLNILWAAHSVLNVLSPVCAALASSFTSLLFHGARGLLHGLTGMSELSPPPPYSVLFTALELAL